MRLIKAKDPGRELECENALLKTFRCFVPSQESVVAKVPHLGKCSLPKILILLHCGASKLYPASRQCLALCALTYGLGEIFVPSIQAQGPRDRELECENALCKRCDWI